MILKENEKSINSDGITDKIISSEKSEEFFTETLPLEEQKKQKEAIQQKLKKEKQLLKLRDQEKKEEQKTSYHGDNPIIISLLTRLQSLKDNSASLSDQQKELSNTFMNKTTAILGDARVRKPLENYEASQLRRAEAAKIIMATAEYLLDKSNPIANVIIDLPYRVSLFETLSNHISSFQHIFKTDKEKQDYQTLQLRINEVLKPALTSTSSTTIATTASSLTGQELQEEVDKFMDELGLEKKEKNKKPETKPTPAALTDPHVITERWEAILKANTSTSTANAMKLLQKELSDIQLLMSEFKISHKDHVAKLNHTIKALDDTRSGLSQALDRIDASSGLDQDSKNKSKRSSFLPFKFFSKSKNSSAKRSPGYQQVKSYLLAQYHPEICKMVSEEISTHSVNSKLFSYRQSSDGRSMDVTINFPYEGDVETTRAIYATAIASFKEKSVTPIQKNTTGVTSLGFTISSEDYDKYLVKESSVEVTLS